MKKMNVILPCFLKYQINKFLCHIVSTKKHVVVFFSLLFSNLKRRTNRRTYKTQFLREKKKVMRCFGDSSFSFSYHVKLL